jgi:hypothetical protein
MAGMYMIDALGELIHLEYLIIWTIFECFNALYFRTEGMTHA